MKIDLELVYGRQMVFQLQTILSIIPSNQLLLFQERIILYKIILFQLFIGLVQLNHNLPNLIRIMMELLCHRKPPA
jgi:hypothetical protein